MVENVVVGDALVQGITLRMSAFKTPRQGWLTVSLAECYEPRQNCNGLFGRQVDSCNLDWNLVRQWLSMCDQKHKDSCKKREGRWGESLEGFRVIDCNTAQIIDAPESCDYAALSYVWGKSIANEMAVTTQLPKPIPLGIEDAMTCTKEIGLRYLWVDRYCIDQHKNSKSKHTLIQSMDQIYGCANVVIIKATGSDLESGLPGVSKESRLEQELVEAFGIQFALIPNLRSQCEKSIWASRGWTFQEGLLGRRRLIFTESQVYFQCLETRTWEGISASVRNIKYNDYDARSFGSLTCDTKLFPALQDHHSWIERRLNGFLQRDLTYDSDVLNAFSGVLHYAWTQSPYIYHFWGLPFPSRVPYETTNLPLESSFILSLLWNGIAIDEQHITRRQGFPSWSVFGWQNIGTVDLFSSRQTFFTEQLDNEVQFQVKDGSQTCIEQYVQRMNRSWNIYDFTPRITVSGWIGRITLRQSVPNFPEKFDAAGIDGHRVGTTRILASPASLGSNTDFADMQKGSWPVLLVHPKNEQNFVGLVLAAVPAEDDTFEKVGTFYGFRFSKTPLFLKSDGFSRPSLQILGRENMVLVECGWKSITLI